MCKLLLLLFGCLLCEKLFRNRCDDSKNWWKRGRLKIFPRWEAKVSSPVTWSCCCCCYCCYCCCCRCCRCCCCSCRWWHRSLPLVTFSWQGCSPSLRRWWTVPHTFCQHLFSFLPCASCWLVVWHLQPSEYMSYMPGADIFFSATFAKFNFQQYTDIRVTSFEYEKDLWASLFEKTHDEQMVFHIQCMMRIPQGAGRRGPSGVE